MCKCGPQVPRSHNKVLLIDEMNGNTKWQQSEELEMKQLMECKAFKSLGIGDDTREGHKKISCHFMHDIKANLMLKPLIFCTRNPMDLTE